MPKLEADPTKSYSNAAQTALESPDQKTDFSSCPTHGKLPFVVLQVATDFPDNNVVRLCCPHCGSATGFSGDLVPVMLDNYNAKINEMEEKQRRVEEYLKQKGAQQAE